MDGLSEEIDPKAFDDLGIEFDLTPGNVLEIPTQQLVTGLQDSKRFASPISDEELSRKMAERIPKKTRQANSWSVQVYREWANHRNAQLDTMFADVMLPIDICEASNPQLNYWLTRFVMEIRRKDGSDYPPNTLTNILSGLQRHLRENGRQVNFFKKDDDVFLTFRQSLDSKMKELTAAGVGVTKNRADPVTMEDELKLWDCVFDNNTAQGLSYAVFFYNCKLFGFRGMDEHRNLVAEQFSVSNDVIGKHVSFSGRISKNVQGGLDHRRVEPKFIKQYADTGNPRCVVRLFERYLDLIPKTGPFYRRPGVKVEDTPRFSQQVVGINTLNKYMKKMFAEANIDTTNRNISNHSGKVTCCTALYNAGLSDKAVMGRSGHRSNAVQVYQRESDDMLKQISNVLQPRTDNIPTKVEVKPKEQIDQRDSGDKQIGDVKPKEQTEIKTCPENKENNVVTVTIPGCVNIVEIIKNGKKIKIEV